MNTILFTWNPLYWQWIDLPQAVVETNQTGTYYDDWSCGQKKNIHPGDRAFLMRLGKHPKGIIGSGYVVSEVFIAPHWDEDLALSGKTANRVHIQFDVLSESPIITEEELLTFHGQVWFPQSSGITIKQNVANDLEKVWQIKTGRDDISSIAEDPIKYREGLKVHKESYYYERNPIARTACLEKFGYKCYVCSFIFEDLYGELGNNFIHVHHIKPLSEVGKEYIIDPLNDLIPVCPNCHAMIHRKVPALEIEVLKALIKK